MKKKLFTENLYPFISIAFAKNSKVHTLVDELYNDDKEKYSTLAKKDFWYNSVLIKGYDLLTEDYAKKMLGLLVDVSNDDLKSLIKKGWPKFYSWATSVESLIIEECFDKFFYESHNNPEHTILSVAIIFAAGRVLCKTVLMDQETSQELLDLINSRANLSSKNLFLHYKNILKEQKDISLRILHSMCDCKQIDNNFKSIWQSDDKDVESVSNIITILFTLEDLSREIVESIDLDANEFAEMIVAYLNFNINDNSMNFIKNTLKAVSSLDNIVDTDFFDFVCSSLSKDNESTFISITYMVYIRKILKAYKKAKEFYTKKASENDKLAENLRKEIAYLKTDNKRLIDQLNKLKTVNKGIEKRLKSEFNKALYQHKTDNKKLNKTIEVLNSKIDSYKSEIQLLLDLNAAMENESSSGIEEIDHDFVNDLNVKGVRGVIVGGHPKWHNMLKGYLPNFKFISVNDINFDISLLKNVDAVFINTKYSSHSLIYKVISTIKNKNIAIYYINRTNKNYVLNKISDIAS